MAKYTVNKDYFKVIDSADKAYWIGFIWGDGYVSKRHRGNSDEYSIKMGLSEIDELHLEKMKRDLESTHELKKYKIQGFDTVNKEVRLLISNKELVTPLYENYGIIPRRDDFSKVVENVPEEFYKDLIRGLIDSDGSIIMRDIEYQKSTRKEFSIGIISNESVLDFFNEQLILEGFTTTHYKRTKRHEGQDGLVRNIRITGNNIVFNILTWLYEDEKELSLNRKYERYELIKNYMLEYREGK